MKHAFKKLTVGAFLLIFICCLNSCKKDKGLLPNIAFKTGASYISGNATIAKNTVFTAGITASKSEGEDILKTFNVSVAYDGATTSTTFYNEILTAAQGDSYSKDVTLTTRNQTGSEKWTFTVTNRDGLVNSVSFIVTVP